MHAALDLPWLKPVAIDLMCAFVHFQEIKSHNQKNTFLCNNISNRYRFIQATKPIAHLFAAKTFILLLLKIKAKMKEKNKKIQSNFQRFPAQNSYGNVIDANWHIEQNVDKGKSNQTNEWKTKTRKTRRKQRQLMDLYSLNEERPKIFCKNSKAIFFLLLFKEKSVHRIRYSSERLLHAPPSPPRKQNGIAAIWNRKEQTLLLMNE